MIYFHEGNAPFVPQFRGNVNSIGIVVSPSLKTNPDLANFERCEQPQCELWNGYKLAVFYRKRIANFSPVVEKEPIFNFDRLRDVILSTSINGIAATHRSPPYCASISKLFPEEIANIISKYSPKQK